VALGRSAPSLRLVDDATDDSRVMIPCVLAELFLVRFCELSEGVRRLSLNEFELDGAFLNRALD
jgi:hypothetical protein